MSDVDLRAEQYENCREAGRILAQVRDEAAERVEVGTNYLELTEWVEERIDELGGNSAFPLNISVDHEAAHGAAGIDDDRTIGEEMVKLDIGVHIDGYGYNPVVNLTGHGLGHWDQHVSPNIPNREVSQGTELDVGDVVAIEPFATDGTGKVSEGSQEEIYALEREGTVRNRAARQALDQITEEFRTLPFATRWLDGSRPEMALRRLQRQDIVHGYPVLKEEDGRLVSQEEHTVIVTGDGCEVTTR